MSLNIIDLAEGNAWEAGADGYIFKAGQGGLEYNWQTFAARANSAGAPWGLYWVIDARYSPEYHKSAIKAAFPTGYFGALGLWLDIEKPRLNMTDAEYNSLPYKGYKPVESAWRGVQAYTSIYPGMYFSPGSWDLIMSGAPIALQQEFAANCEEWIANYGVLVPGKRGYWDRWAMWQWRAEPDYNRVNPEWWASVTGATPVPAAYVVQRKLSDVDILLTPSTTDVLPLKTPLAQAQEYGWDASMNCGAGFSYTDATHAQVKGTSISQGVQYSTDASFESLVINAQTSIPYARRMITGGIINYQLDQSYRAPWSMLGYGSAQVFLIVTTGQEGADGMTQFEAAQWALSQGITDLYLFDSGHSSGITEHGTLLYSAYGESIPQCVGLKAKTTNGGTLNKGTVKTGLIANIKSTTAAPLPIPHTMTGGEYVYAELSATGSDLIGFSHYYTAAGVKVELGTANCKVNVINMIVVKNVTEPGGTVPPPTVNVPHMRQVLTDDDGEVWLFECDGVKQ